MCLRTNHFKPFACAIVVALTLLTPSVQAQQVAIPTTPAQVPGPVSGNKMTTAYVQFVGRMAYIWGYAMVNAHNRRAAFAGAPTPGLLGGVVPVAPVGYNAMLTNYIKPDETFIVCPNQDVAYGAGFTALDKEPTVVQVPDFGDRFYVYALYDQRTDEIAQIGKQYGTKPGFYLIAGANWNGTVPPGITAVVRSSTDLVFVVPRIFKDDTAEDTKAVQPLINQVMMYPLSKFDGKMKTTDYSKLPDFPVPKENVPKGESKWVNPATYYDELPVVMKEVPPLPGEEALYGWIKSVWDAAARDPKTRQTLVESFVAANTELVDPWFQFQYNGRSVGHGWTSAANASQWGTDYLNRSAVSKSSMYQNTPEETQYQLKEFDSQGAHLNGNNQYTVTFPKGQLPPVKGFWSLTLYNEQKLFFPNPLNHFSLGTKNKSLKYNADSSLTLYLGAKSPGKDKETNWLPAPNGNFSLILRNYWPEHSIIDGSWTPPDVVKANSGRDQSATAGRTELSASEEQPGNPEPFAPAGHLVLAAAEGQAADPQSSDVPGQTKLATTQEKPAATESEESKTAALAKAAQNPVANLISFPLQNNTAFGIGPYERAQNVLNIQPVIPFHITEKWNLITRTILPVVWQPNDQPTQGWFGFGDLNPSLFLSPAKPGKLIWGVGPALVLPTATAEQLGQGKFSLGPSVVVLSTPGHWVLGALVNNVWSVAGPHERAVVNQMLLQWFVNYNMKKGWYLVTSPIVTADWRAPSGNQAVVPFGGGVGRIMKLGFQPVNITGQFYGNAVHPEGTSPWGMRLQIQFLFPQFTKEQEKAMMEEKLKQLDQQPASSPK